MRVVIDTNVVVSRFLSPDGTPARILSFWENSLFELIVTDPILAGYRRVLAYDRIRSRHGLNQEEIEQTVAGFRNFAVLVEPVEPIVAIVDDPSDDRFLEAAVAGGCDYVVSGDPHLLRLGEYRGIQILTPAAFRAVLEQESS
jgi:putative PIN family toxin of toxin-antitoxin system